MQIIHHAIISIIAILFLYPLFGLSVLWIFVGGVLVDFDHYLWHLFSIKKEGPIKAYKFFKEKKHKKHLPVTLIFHTLEFGVIFFVLTYFFNTLIPVFIGYILHMVSDFFYDITGGRYWERKRILIKSILNKY